MDLSKYKTRYTTHIPVYELCHPHFSIWCWGKPGPRKPIYPCQICHRAVTRGQKGVSCDDCNLWYHAECMHIPSHIYNCLNNISWNCVTCGMPQFTSNFFDSLDIHMQNSFSSIASEDSLKAAHQRGKQQVTQSWNKFIILNLNFQSIKNKKSETLNIIQPRYNNRHRNMVERFSTQLLRYSIQITI